MSGRSRYTYTAAGMHAYDKTDYFKPTEPNAAGSARPHTGRHGISDLSREDLTEA